MSFFGGMPFPVQFFLAFVIVLGLIGATAWAVRRFGAGRIGGAGLRGRQPRLAVVDYASVDGRRRLILVRRDNVEHLVMIGGPTDVVVESNIVRAAAAPRDAATARSAAVEALPRAIPLPDSAANGSWPLQPEPSAANGGPRAARSESLTEEPSSWPLQPHGEAPARAHRDTLAALADELSVRPVASSRSRPQASVRPHPVEPRQEMRQEARQEPRLEPRMQAAQPAAADAEAADQSLAEMAHRLEAALRKPSAKPERSDAREPRPAPMPRAAMPAEQVEAAEPAQAPAAPAPAPSASTRSTRTTEIKPSRPEAKQPSPGKALYDSLEQEMASLLGRPAGKN